MGQLGFLLVWNKNSKGYPLSNGLDDMNNGIIFQANARVREEIR